jgi:transposase
MPKGKTLKVNFKTYNQHQAMLLPPTLDELIKPNHPVRVVSAVLDKIDIGPLLRTYKTGGTSSYHPLMLLKVTVYAYINNIYSSRKIEEALEQNIHFMWLSGMNQPDHNTINRFRSDRLKEPLRKIFVQVVELLALEGLLSLKELYTDGTKIEANANRYTFVWGKSISTNKEKMKKQLDDLWTYAQSVAASELDDTDPTDFDNISPEKVKAFVEKIDASLKDKPVDPKVRQKLNYARKNWPQNLEKYEQQERILKGERNSFSKTDPDATFMRMKDDHMRNGQLKPAYNLQISTNNQFITNYSIHHNATDTNTLKPHLQQFEEQYKALPAVVTADAGYGSEENLSYLEKQKIKGYVKYNQFDREQNNNIQSKRIYAADKLEYRKKEDVLICPIGKPMQNIGSFQKKTLNGFKQTITKYEATGCAGCPLKNQCHKSERDRVIEVNHNLNRLKKKSSKNLLSKKGIAHRKRRCHDVEPVFANMKNNHQFRRFMLRGKEKVNIEVGLLALAHNLRKKVA